MDSFYCDCPRFIKLACTDTYRLEFLVTANSGLISMGTFFLLIVSYVFILVTVRKHSSGVSSKALSILSAHITVVVFFLVSALLSMWPFPTLPIDQFLAIFDAIVTPFMNPVIYTFRNKKMKVAVRRIFVKS
jgi:olfactory receptor